MQDRYIEHKEISLSKVPRRNYISVIGQDINLFYDHLDGLYSVCYTKDQEIVNLGRETKVKILNEKPKDWQ